MVASSVVPNSPTAQSVLLIVKPLMVWPLPLSVPLNSLVLVLAIGVNPLPLFQLDEAEQSMLPASE
ncbi:MAG: hypothetical protein WDN66_04900 [Candidatus Saccharibacteria bacterium]